MSLSLIPRVRVNYTIADILEHSLSIQMERYGKNALRLSQMSIMVKAFVSCPLLVMLSMNY